MHEHQLDLLDWNKKNRFNETVFISALGKYGYPPNLKLNLFY